MKKLLPATAIFLLLLTACKMTKYTPEKLPPRQVVFGDGGGFTGTETTVTLLENGQLFKQTGVEGTYVELEPIQSKTAKELFEKVNSLQLFKLDIDKPGNMYYFLREVTDHLDSRVTWGAGDYLPPEALVNVYKELKAISKNREAVKTKKSTNDVPSGGNNDERKTTDDANKW